MKQKIAIGSDHAGFKLKEFLKENAKSIEWLDLGPTQESRVDYPDFAEKVADLVQQKKVDFGVLVCGSGIGMAIAANKLSGIRAVAPESEMGAELSRAHNNANVLCLGARLLAPEYAQRILETWLKTSFEGGRHDDRVKKIAQLEKRGSK